MEYRIAVLPGDGIGPEVVAEGVKVLRQIATQYDLSCTLREGLVGGAAIEATGDPLPAATSNHIPQNSAANDDRARRM